MYNRLNKGIVLLMIENCPHQWFMEVFELPKNWFLSSQTTLVIYADYILHVESQHVQKHSYQLRVKNLSSPITSLTQITGTEKFNYACQQAPRPISEHAIHHEHIEAWKTSEHLPSLYKMINTSTLLQSPQANSDLPICAVQILKLTTQYTWDNLINHHEKLLALTSIRANIFLHIHNQAMSYFIKGLLSTHIPSIIFYTPTQQEKIQNTFVPLASYAFSDVNHVACEQHHLFFSYTVQPIIHFHTATHVEHALASYTPPLSRVLSKFEFVYSVNRLHEGILYSSHPLQQTIQTCDEIDTLLKNADRYPSKQELLHTETETPNHTHAQEVVATNSNHQAFDDSNLWESHHLAQMSDNMSSNELLVEYSKSKETTFDIDQSTPSSQDQSSSSELAQQNIASTSSNDDSNQSFIMNYDDAPEGEYSQNLSMKDEMELPPLEDDLLFDDGKQTQAFENSEIEDLLQRPFEDSMPSLHNETAVSIPSHAQKTTRVESNEIFNDDDQSDIIDVSLSELSNLIEKPPQRSSQHHQFDLHISTNTPQEGVGLPTLRQIPTDHMKYPMDGDSDLSSEYEDSIWQQSTKPMIQNQLMKSVDQSMIDPKLEDEIDDLDSDEATAIQTSDEVSQSLPYYHTSSAKRALPPNRSVTRQPMIKAFTSSQENQSNDLQDSKRREPLSHASLNHASMTPNHASITPNHASMSHSQAPQEVPTRINKIPIDPHSNQVTVHNKSHEKPVKEDVPTQVSINEDDTARLDRNKFQNLRQSPHPPSTMPSSHSTNAPPHQTSKTYDARYERTQSQSQSQSQAPKSKIRKSFSDVINSLRKK